MMVNLMVPPRLGLVGQRTLIPNLTRSRLDICRNKPSDLPVCLSEIAWMWIIREIRNFRQIYLEDDGMHVLTDFRRQAF